MSNIQVNVKWLRTLQSTESKKNVFVFQVNMKVNLFSRILLF